MGHENGTLLGAYRLSYMEVIQKGNGPVQVSTNTHGQIRVLPPKTAEEILARERERERERKARTTLLMAIPEYNLAKFHKMTDAKEMWEVIKSRFGGNDESKKMQKYLLKQQFESFSVSNSEGLHKGYVRFQSLLSQLETHGAGVSTKDANQKFLRSLPFSWSQVLLDHLLAHRIWHLFLLKTLAVLMKLILLMVVLHSGHNSQKEGSSSYTDDLVYSFFANQSSGLQLDHEDLEQVDEFDLEEMDLKWQVAMISTRLKKFYKKTRRKLHFDAKEPVGFDKSNVECFNCHNTRHISRECRSKGNQDSRKRDTGNTGYKAMDNGNRHAKQDEHKAMVTINREGVDWTGHAKNETEDYALMACNSSNSGSNTEISAKDKSRLGYGSQIHDGVLSYENEVFASVFDSRSSDIEDSLVNDRFVKVKGMHAVLPLMTGNYMPSKFDFGIDELKFTYGPKQSTTSESNAKTSDLYSCDSNSSVETFESVPKPVTNEPKAVSEPKVWFDAPIIEEYESDSDDERTLKGKGIVDSGCSRYMIGNKAYLVDYQDFNGGPVAFGGSKGQITGISKITPLFPSMLTQATVKEGEDSGAPTESQPIPSPTQPSGSGGDQVKLPHDSPLSGGHTSDRAEGSLNLEEISALCTNLSYRVLALEIVKDAQVKEILTLKAKIKKLEKRKSDKPRPKLDDSAGLDADGVEYMEAEEDVDEGRTRNKTEELNLDDDTKVITKEKGSGKKGENTISTARPKRISTADVTISTADPEVNVVEPKNPPTTTSIFDDEDITMAQTLIKMKEEKAKEKGVAFKEVEESDRPARSVLTLKPLPTIDTKDKGKAAADVHKEKVLEEHESTKVLKMKARKKAGKQTHADDESSDKVWTVQRREKQYRIFRSNGSSRWIKTFAEMITRFDRLDLVELYNLVMQRFETTTPEGVDLILWGDLRTMFEANAEDELWQN
nr:xylulose kinase-1 [Tanacetum cinerariifolium]